MHYYIIQTNSGELYHHGILGQKWGHRQGPPYPLDSGDHSSSEKRAGWRKSLSDRMSEREMKAHEVAIEKSQLKLKTEQGRKADELYSKANAITERKDFDPRNAETKAKYDRLIKEADRLNKEAEELVKAEMDKKYGEKYLKDLERARSRDSALIVAGSLAAIPLLPIIIPTALIAASIKSKKANKNGRT